MANTRGNFDVVYPAEGRATFQLGLNNKFPRTEILDSESPDCFDVVFTNGAVETRPGYTRLNTFAIGAYAGDGIYTRRDNSGAETMVVFGGGSAWQLAATTFSTIPSAQSVFTAGVRVATAQYENHMFVGNGGVTPYKYDGTYFTRHGVPAPTQTAVVSSAITGFVGPGDWVYAYTYVNSAAVEGNLSPLAGTFTVSASGTVSMSAIGTAPQSFGVGSRRIYRATSTTGVGISTYKRVGTIADNTTTTFIDNVPNASLGTTAPTDNGEPPVYSVCCYHQNRLFCNDAANPNFLWFSELFTPYTFKSTNFQGVGDNSFDLIKGMTPYSNGIIIQCENSIQLLNMPSTDPSTWGIIRTRGQYGSKSPFGTFLYQNSLMMPAMQNSKFCGFASVTGTSLDTAATYLTHTTAESDLASDRIEPDMFQVQETYASGISALVFKNKAYIAVPFGSGATSNNRVYLFDFSMSNATQQSTAYSPLANISAVQFAVYNARLYFLEQATGFVYQLETTSYNDNGTAINSYFWTKEFSGNPGHENLQKDFRKVKLFVDKPGAYYMNLTYRTDSDHGAGNNQQVSLDPGSAVWGTLIWGAGSWGAGVDQQEVTVTLGQCTGKRIQFKFSNQNAVNQKFKVRGLNFTYNIKGKR